MQVEVLGPDDAPDLVLLHGGVGTGRYHWGRQADRLAERFRVHLPDLPGHGGTPPPDGPYTRQVLVDAVAGYLDELGGTAHVAGFSMGGHTALALCADAPGRFASLVLVGVAIAEHDGLAWWRGRFYPDVLAREYPMWARKLSKLHRPLGGDDAWRDVCRRDTNGMAVEVDVEALSALDAPVLLLRGDRDPVVDPVQYASLRRAWPQADEAVVPGGLHDIQLTRADLVGTVLSDFYARAVPDGDGG